MATNKTISLMLPDELAMKLSIYCAEHAANRSALIRKAIKEFLAKEDRLQVMPKGITK